MQTLVAVGGLPPAVTEPLQQLIGWTMWLICLAAVGRLIWIGGEMGHHRSDPSSEPPDSPVWVFVGLIVAASSSGIAGALLV